MTQADDRAYRPVYGRLEFGVGYLSNIREDEADPRWAQEAARSADAMFVQWFGSRFDIGSWGHPGTPPLAAEAWQRYAAASYLEQSVTRVSGMTEDIAREIAFLRSTASDSAEKILASGKAHLPGGKVQDSLDGRGSRFGTLGRG